jgi:hypothetical protein
MLHYLENTYLIEYRTCGHAWSKTITGRGKTLIVYKKNLDTSESLLDYKGYSYL